MSFHVDSYKVSFSQVEGGSVRKGKERAVILKNLLDACLGALVFYFFGYRLSFGDSGNGFIGFGDSGESVQYQHQLFNFAVGVQSLHSKVTSQDQLLSRLSDTAILGVR